MDPSSPSTPNPTPVQGSTPNTSPIVFAPAPPDYRRRYSEYEIAAIADPPPTPSTPAPRDSELYTLPQSISAFYEDGTNILNTFGALPYPEWRMELVARARKSGLGGINRGMEMHLWGGDPCLLENASFNTSISSKRTSSIISTNGSLDVAGDEEESLRRKKKKKAERKLTLEHENKAIGIQRTESGSSIVSKGKSSVNNRKQRGKTEDVEGGDDDTYYSADEGNGKGSGSESSELTGVPDSDDDDSGEESSDAEWMGWMADLYRQSTVYRDNQKKRKEEKSKSLIVPQAERDVYIQEDDYRLAQRERIALEPTGVVLSPQVHLLTAAHVSSLASTPLHTPAPSIANTFTDDTYSYSHQYPSTIAATRLSSPSSNESLRRLRGRRLSFGMSMSPPPQDPPPGSTPPSARHNRSNSQKLPSGLFHFASTGVIGAEFREREFGIVSGSGGGRRPSMPTLVSVGDTTGKACSSHGTSSLVSSPQPSTVTFASVEPLGDALDERVGRRASLTMTSFGRSSSKRRKKELEIEREKERAKKEREREKTKGKEKEKEKDRGKDREKEEKKGKERERDEPSQTDHPAEIGKAVGKTRRPRLSLSTGSRQNLSNLSQQHQPAPLSQSPPPTTTRQVIRRMRSGSSLMSGGEVEGENHSKNGPKKKKTGLVRGVSMRAEKLVQGLESALDFVDGRQT